MGVGEEGDGSGSTPPMGLPLPLQSPELSPHEQSSPSHIGKLSRLLQEDAALQDNQPEFGSFVPGVIDMFGIAPEPLSSTLGGPTAGRESPLTFGAAAPGLSGDVSVLGTSPGGGRSENSGRTGGGGSGAAALGSARKIELGQMNVIEKALNSLRPIHIVHHFDDCDERSNVLCKVSRRLSYHAKSHTQRDTSTLTITNSNINMHILSAYIIEVS